MQSTCCILVAAKKSVRNLVRRPMKMKVSPSCHFPLTKAEEGPKCISDMLQQQQVVTGSQPEQQPSNNINIIICNIFAVVVVAGLIRNRLFYFILFCACLFLVFVVSSSFTHIIRAFHCRSVAVALLPRCLVSFWPNISISLAFQFSSVQVRVSSGLSFVSTRRSSCDSKL